MLSMVAIEVVGIYKLLNITKIHCESPQSSLSLDSVRAPSSSQFLRHVFVHIVPVFGVSKGIFSKS